MVKLNAERFICVNSGKWEIIGSYFGGVIYAVRKKNGIWELQDVQGNLVFGDGFESLENIRGFLMTM